MGPESQNLTRRVAAMFATLMVAGMLLSTCSESQAGDPPLVDVPPIVVSQPDRPLGEHPGAVVPRMEMPPGHVSRWRDRLRKSLPGLRNRNTIPPIIVGAEHDGRTLNPNSGNVQATDGRNSKTRVDAASRPGRIVLRSPSFERTDSSTQDMASSVSVGRVRLVAAQSSSQDFGSVVFVPVVPDIDDDFEMIEDDVAPPSTDKSSDSKDESSAGLADSAKTDAANVPGRRHVPLSQLFARMDSIDLALSATQSVDPTSEISLPANAAQNHLGAVRPWMGTPIGGTQKYLQQREVQLTNYPLYFENAAAERCGVGQGCYTTLASAACFFGRVSMVPYMLTAERPGQIVFPKTDCENGESDAVGQSSRGCLSLSDLKPTPTVVEALAVTALVFIIP